MATRAMEKQGTNHWLWIGAGALAVGAAAVAAKRLASSGEQPEYQTITADGAFSIRAYPPLVVAETRQYGMREPSLRRGFGMLADYIFAKERPGEKIAMTAPVLSDTDQGAWRTRFVLPARYSAEAAPTPQAGVSIATLPARRVAAVRFSGVADDAVLADQEARLRRWVYDRGLVPAGPAEHAFYNAPFVPGLLRRNEVLIALAD
ncbi:heme-binding protein [Sphingomonas sp. BGYR3]|uniref:SOUL family heme-binding protein n=1 Tax=Sphingomonas sp. BGYR3 TaxID=2975483 RepID=UPI0021A56619|nr:heme-binding protein [Sphingomonas sp. BGYR3]MDG5489475.1 heme-binding protein [Sphingomonas sp. BGYR3]